jgi:hypothetical protein
MTIINNFSELPDTKSIDITIAIAPAYIKVPPEVIVKFNNVVKFSGVLTDSMQFNETVDLLSEIHIGVSLVSKINEKQAIILKCVNIDNTDILNGLMHTAYYENEYTDPTKSSTYLGAPGTWKLDISEPFYRWKHKVTGQGWLL